MALLDTIRQIILTANAARQATHPDTPTYQVLYEESSMMNIRADELDVTDSFVYIEEFITGKYVKEKYFKAKTMKMQLYFCKFSTLHQEAEAREALRNQLEAEIVEPFMDAYKASTLFTDVVQYNLSYPFPRFDANEVSVMLEFDCTLKRC